MPAAYSDPNKLSHINLSRNDSLKSERSDKRVSFNKDVGVKHIPRGLKRQAPQPPIKDEWGNYIPIHREPPPLSSIELEKQAEDLVRLLDQVDCIARSNSDKNPQFSSRSLDRANNKNNSKLTKLKNNTVINLARRNNLNNGDKSSDKSSTVFEPKGKQPFINFGKNNIRRERKSRPVRRSHSTHSYINENSSDTDYPSEKYSRFKSEPDIQRAVKNTRSKAKRIPNTTVNKLNITSKNDGPMSVDNIYKDNRAYPNPYRRRPNARNEYKSADNLTDVSIPGNRDLHEFKSVENLQSGYSSSDFDTSYGGNFNKQSKSFEINENQQPRSHTIMYEEPTSPRGLKSPNQYHAHNKNKPFSYTGGSLSSIEEVRKLSPSREIPRYTEDQYAKINKNIKRSTLPSNKDKQYNHNNDDYSAKIIIKSQPIINRYDDDAYETYQVREGSLTKQIRDLGISSHLKSDYKNISNNNINMSSIGVQTEKLPKAPNRQRRQYHSPIRNGYSEENINSKGLSSATLVRQVSHEFGRIDRSPSPPPRVVASHRKQQRNVVPLLSDTDESEFNYRRNKDPLAKIRDQVKIREQMQKENEEGQQIGNRYYSNRPTTIKEYGEPKLQPLTIDEVDALEFEVDSKGRNSLVVAREGYLSNSSRYLNERPHVKKTENTDQNRSFNTKDRNVSYRNGDKELDKSNDKSPSRFFSTLERIKRGATEKSKNILDKKDPKSKDKKKKRIKIKFFYDPKPEETNMEDPLSRFTEYKGSSSDEITSRNNQDYQRKLPEYELGQVKQYRGTRPRSRETTLERRQNYDTSSDKRDYSSSPSRPPRYSSGERIIGRDHHKNRNERELSIDRSMNRSYPDDKNNSYNYNSSYQKEPEKKYGNEYESKSHEYRKDYHFNTRNQEYKGERQEHRELAYKNEENIPYDRYGTNERRKTPEKNIALSDKYKSLTRNSSPPREIYVMNGKNKTYQDDSIPTEDEEKLGKIQRQRKKFFGVLRGEGRTKPSTKTSFRKQNDQKGSSNTLTKARGIEENDVEAARIIEKVKEQTYRNQQQHKKPWPWSIINIRSNKNNKLVKDRRTLRHSRPLSRASSKASSKSGSRISNKPTRPSIRSIRVRNDRYNDRSHVPNDRYDDGGEKRQWKNSTLSKTDNRSRSNDRKSNKYFADSSSSVGTPVNTKGKRFNSRQRYFGDTDSENRRNDESGRGDYRSLPNRKARSSPPNRFVMGARRNFNSRGMSPGARGSAGSSLQSSESEADSHGGSHASRASRASHVSTGSNRSVYLHATAVADIPVRRNSDDSPSERGINRQSKKVSRSFSLASPWKPRHVRDRYEVEYDNREIRDNRHIRQKSSLPPRPPRKSLDPNENKRVGRSQTVYKDSKLAGWLRKKKNKEPGKGI